MNKETEFNQDVTYYLLRELALKSEFTQLDLSRKIGVSAGKVNYVLSGLIQKGLVKMENFKQSKSRKGYIYLLTPDGIKAKKVITLNFIKRKMDEYERLEREIGKARQEIGEEIA